MFKTHHGNHGSAQTVSGDGFGEVDPLGGFGVVLTECQHGQVQHEQPSGAEGESHDGTGAERRVETGRPSWFLRRYGRADVTVHGDFHTKVSTSLFRIDKVKTKTDEGQ